MVLSCKFTFEAPSLDMDSQTCISSYGTIKNAFHENRFYIQIPKKNGLISCCVENIDNIKIHLSVKSFTFTCTLPV